jgi:uncharacterized protein (TIGR03663 family)
MQVSWRSVAAGALIIIAAAILRLYQLDLKPLHHDEGVNGYFVLKLIRERTYIYDPANYHGPTLYYFSLITCGYMNVLFGKAGVTAVALRLVPAIFGIATVWIVILLRRFIGYTAAAFAAVLLALSPGAVYFSRYFIHEAMFAFFTLAVVASGIKYVEDGRPKYLMYGSASAALLFATKETVIIAAAVLVLAATGTHIFTRYRRGSASSSMAILPRRLLRPAMLGSAAALFIVIVTALYSAFLLNFPQGIYDVLGTLRFWTATATVAHKQPWYTYLEWLWQEEKPLVVVAFTGLILIAWRGGRFHAFCALWAAGMIAAYSCIPYKAPWLTLNMLVPLALTAGAGFQIASVSFGRYAKILLAFSAIVVSAIALQQSVKLNFFDYDNEERGYAYAHTQRAFLKLVEAIDRISERRGGRDAVTITVASAEYWPMPWYLRDFPKTGYPGRLEEPAHTDMIIVSHKQEAQAKAFIGADYEYVSTYALRPGVDLLLFVRRSPLVPIQP